MDDRTLGELLQRAGSWPEQDQEELADYARVIEARRSGFYQVSDAERAAIAEGLSEAEREDFVTDVELATTRKSDDA